MVLPSTQLFINGAYVLSAWEIGYEYAYTKKYLYWDAANTSNEGVNFRIIKT